MEKRRIFFTFLIMTLLLALLFVWNLSIGTVNISFGQLSSILIGLGKGSVNEKIIMNIRLPRILAAMILGGALALSGFLLQTFFQNPIAGPYVLGISSGAKLFVAITMIFFLNKSIVPGSLALVASAFLGSLLTMGLVLLFSIRVRKMSVLIVCGILIGYICSAVTDFFITFANDSNIVNLHNWSVGSFSGINMGKVRVMTLVVFVCLAAAFVLSKPIGAFQLGENYARNMGVNVRFLRVLLILISSLLSACVTAFAGPISFVGIAVPHLVKSAVNTARPLVLIPACFLGGAIVTVFCDGAARTLFSPTEVSVSSVTAVLLVPVVIYMMLRRR